MALSKDFLAYVEAKDLRSVRICIKNCLLADHSLTNFKEYVAFAEQQLSRDVLYQQHDGEELNANCQNWNREYLAVQLAKVLRNFSPQRLEHLQEVIRWIYRDEVRQNTCNVAPTVSHSRRDSHLSVKWIAVIVGGVLCAGLVAWGLAKYLYSQN